ncbi:MAG: preprotein translocase subunit SecE [Candidatus Paceibacterota bacterium]|jgi:preprotein translocase subunit SecE
MSSNSTNKLTLFFREVKTEVKKVSWPTRQEVFNYTLIVIIASVSVAIFLGGLDVLFQKAINYILLNLPK